MKKILILTAILMVGSALNLSATPISDVSVFSVSGAMMDGMLVSVTDDSGNTSYGIWNDLGGDKGGASADGWYLTFDGSDTWAYGAAWMFSADDYLATVKSFTINTIPGKTVFDILSKGPGDNLNTVGSQLGWWQGLENDNPYDSGMSSRGDPISGTEPNFSWSFTDPITLGGLAAGDLFGQLTITFNHTNSYWKDINTFNFEVDTDNITPVPEPATAILLATGLAGLFGINRRRKK